MMMMRGKRQKKMSAMNQLAWDTSTTSPHSSPVRSATYTAKVKSSRTCWWYTCFFAFLSFGASVSLMNPCLFNRLFYRRLEGVYGVFRGVLGVYMVYVWCT